MMDHTTSAGTWAASAISTLAIMGGLLGWAPAAGAFVAMIWYMIKIYESATVQRWVHNRRVRKLARLKAQVIVLEAHVRPALPPPETADD